jgi:carboxylesterase type B
MMSYWANFVATGNPNGATVPPWPAFDPAHPVVLRLGESIEPRPPLPAERAGLFAP